MRLLACLALAAALARSADLEKTDRTIAALPTFKAKEQFYALVVLGADAATRIWFVADGEDLYVDRNGNADLTDDGAPLRAAWGGQSEFTPSIRSWKLDRLSVAGSYTRIEVDISMLNPAWRPAAAASNRARMERFMEAVAKLPHVNLSSIRIDCARGRMFGHAMLRTSPREAPIFHLDAPLTLGLVESILPTTLQRGDKPDEIILAVGVPGHSPDHAGCFSYLMYDKLPDAARPVVEVEFPAKEPGKYLPRRRVTIDGKC